jgi:short-subunit dehydrogenase
VTASGGAKNFKNVFITGASSGIGREVAQQLASTAEHLWICGRNSGELDKTRSLLLEVNPQLQVTCLIGDFSIESQRKQIITAVIGEGLDLVILNAGGGDFELFSNSNFEAQRKTIDLNITATVHLTHSLLPQLKKTRAKGLPCALVFVSSHAAFLHVPHFAVYASAKSFINSFALTLMQEERESGIDFLLVCPGATATQFAERAGLPNRMLGSPKSPADVAQMLVSNIGQRRMLIVNPFDRVLYFASRVLPTFIFDAIVTRTQHKLLTRASRQKEISL